MEYTSYKDMEQAIRLRVEFDGNSARGVLEADGEYRVYSYRTVIATYRGGVSWLDNEKYSATTSRLQNIVRRAWGVV